MNLLKFCFLPTIIFAHERSKYVDKFNSYPVALEEEVLRADFCTNLHQELMKNIDLVVESFQKAAVIEQEGFHIPMTYFPLRAFVMQAAECFRQNDDLSCLDNLKSNCLSTVSPVETKTAITDKLNDNILKYIEYRKWTGFSLRKRNPQNPHDADILSFCARITYSIIESESFSDFKTTTVPILNSRYNSAFLDSAQFVNEILTRAEDFQHSPIGDTSWSFQFAPQLAILFASQCASVNWPSTKIALSFSRGDADDIMILPKGSASSISIFNESLNNPVTSSNDDTNAAKVGRIVVSTIICLALIIGIFSLIILFKRSQSQRTKHLNRLDSPNEGIVEPLVVS